jgi:hypothetical protein
MRSVSSIAAVGLVVLAGQAVSADGGAQHRTRQTPPVKMGTSGGSLNDRSSVYCCGGTLGALVQRDGVLHILSNNHVLARSGSAAAGEDTIQPGLIDLGCNGATANIVGDFAGNLVPLGSANVDAAISVARANVDTSGFILDIGVPCSTIQAPAVNMPVMKSGRTTGFSTGTITSINTSVQIQYQRGCNTGRRFNITYTNQIATTNMSAGGDSGSLTLSNDGTPNPVGLLFAGSSSVTIHNRIQDVVNAFTAGGHTFSFVGGNCGLSAEAPPPPAPAPADLDRALQVKVEHEHDLFQNRGVLGVGIGATAENPVEPAIVIYFEQPGENGRVNLPNQIDGITVRVILTDPIVAH